MVGIETPSNPLLKIIDLAAVASIRTRARDRGFHNTFASPWIQRPIEFGFDLVIHSATKYLNGHSTWSAALSLLVKTIATGDQNRVLQNSVGAIAGPFAQLSAESQDPRVADRANAMSRGVAT